MKDSLSIADSVLERIAGRAEASVYVTTGPAELTRFANSFIHQNVGEMISTVELTVATDGRVASVGGSVTTDDGLARLVEQALEVAKVSPVDPDWAGVAPAAPVAQSPAFFDSTDSVTPADRADAVAAYIDAGEGLNAAGYCETQSLNHGVATTAGQRASGRATRTVFDGILRSDSASGSAHHTSADFATLNAAQLGREAKLRAELGGDPMTLDTGTYEVVLGHDAAAEVVMELGLYGFNGSAAVDEQSFVREGVQQFDSRLSIIDDPLGPGGLNVGFDPEGTPKRQMTLVGKGVSGALCHSRKTAHKMGGEPNGHAPVGDIGDWYGGGPADLVVTPGTKTVDELIADVERGVFVATFNYCRCVDPLTVEITGLTRNGTYLIEEGQIVSGLTNMRFTQSFVDALAPGNLLDLSNDPRYGTADAGPAYVRTPAMRLANFNFTGNAEG